MGYDAEQRKTIAALVAQGRKQGASRKEVLSAFETALTEASLRNPNYGDGSSVGWRQETSSSYPNANRLDLNASAARFYQELRGVRGKGLTASQAAQAVQRSAFPGRYKQHQQEGVDLVHQFYDKAGNPTVPKAAPTAKTVTTTPGVDNSATRKQMLLSYVGQRQDPNALLSLASGLKDAQDVPATTKVDISAAVKVANKVAPVAAGGARAVQLAAGKLGVREQGQNSGPGPAQFQNVFGIGSQAWCGAFVGAIAKQAGAKGITSRVTYVPNVVADAKAGTNGFTGWSSDPHQARAGDFVVLFGSSHVEMVVSVNKDGSLNTIGGNTSAPGGEGVARKTRGRGDITGVAHVKY